MLTKKFWVSYFGVVGIDRAWAYRLMPWVGAMDVSLGLTMAVVTTAERDAAPDRLGPLDGGTAPALG